MDPLHRDIRFTTTEDGVDIAYWAIGGGKPVVILSNRSIAHVEREWTIPSMASFYRDMAERYRVVRFDPRGAGLSGEPPGGWGALTESGAQRGLSNNDVGLDISAVAAALELDSFALLAMTVYGPGAIEYAATHPEVTELILCDSFAAVASSWIADLLRAQSSLADLESDTGQVFSVWRDAAPPEEAELVVDLALEGRRQPGQGLTQLSQLEWDAESFLPRLSIPTLILNSRFNSEVALGDARHLAARISGSQLRVVEGRFPPYWSDRQATLEAIDALLKPMIPTEDPGEAGFRTIVFTDIVGSTEYVRSVGDEAGRAAVRDLEQKIASLATAHGGRVVKNLGDGSLVSFASNSSAIRFGLEVQEKSSNGPLQLRVGMAAGEPIQEEGDIHGTVVAHASRIGDLGDGGEVIVSDSVRQLASGKGFTFEPRGEVILKGFDEPERIWRVVRQ